MKNFFRPYLNPIESFEDLVLYEKTNMLLFGVFYYLFSGLMLIVPFHIYPNKILVFVKSILGIVYFANVIGLSIGASFALFYSKKVSAIKNYSDLEDKKRKFYLSLYLASGVPFMALIAWAIVYADLRFAFEMILAFVATVGAMYFGDWKGFKSYRFN